MSLTLSCIKIGRAYRDAIGTIVRIQQKVNIKEHLLEEEWAFVGIVHHEEPYPIARLYYEDGASVSGWGEERLVACVLMPLIYNIHYPHPRPGEVWKTRNGSKVLLTSLNLEDAPRVLRGIIINYPDGSRAGESCAFHQDGVWSCIRRESGLDLIRLCKNQTYDKSKFMLPGDI